MQKLIEIAGLEHPVTLSRRKGTKNLRISIKNSNKVVLSVPYGIPESAAKLFVTSKIDWIQKNIEPARIISNGAHIGKSHRLVIEPSNANRHSTKVTSTEIVVRLPADIAADSPKGQAIIKKACDKALLQQATRLLPQRLEFVSKKTGVDYRTCTVKKLKSRWGACDSRKNISLNSYLIQLDWDLIDYVICHELAHTHHAHHQKEFWDFVATLCPDYKQLRKQLKTHPTDINPTNF